MTWPPWWCIKVKEDGVAMDKVNNGSAVTKVFAGKALAKRS